MKCPYCGSEITENTAYCPNCGQNTADVLDNVEVSGEAAKYWDKVVKENKADYNTHIDDYNKKEKSKKKLGRILLVISILLAIGVFAIVLINVIIPMGNYSKAITLMDSGEYTEAVAIFEKLDNYKDSRQKLTECNAEIDNARIAIENAEKNEQYENALSLFNDGNYEDALSIFESLNGYLNSNDYINRIKMETTNIQFEQETTELAAQRMDTVDAEGNFIPVQEETTPYSEVPLENDVEVTNVENANVAVYDVSVSNQNNAYLRKGPGEEYSLISQLSNGQVIRIDQTVTNSDDGRPWGRTNIGGNTGWISLNNTNRVDPSTYNQASDTTFYDNQYTAVVSSSENYMNFRTGPGRSNNVITQIPNGTVLSVNATLSNSSDGLVWGQTSYNGITGWISMRQTFIQDMDSSSKAQYYVTVQNSTNIGLRRGPGMEYDLLLGNIQNGTSLYITETVINSFDGRPWGKTNINGMDGWVSLNWTYRS